MVNVIKEIQPYAIQPLRNISRFSEPLLAGHNLKVRGLEFYSYAKSSVALSSQTSGDCFGRSTQVQIDIRPRAHIRGKRMF